MILIARLCYFAVATLILVVAHSMLIKHPSWVAMIGFLAGAAQFGLATGVMLKEAMK